MPTALTGQWGQPGSQPGLAQLGGPAVMQKFDRSLPALTKPLIAHVFQNNGVTPVLTFSPLNRPLFSATTTNGGGSQALLAVEKPVAGLVQGNVVRLSEQGGDGTYIYSGIVEDLPDSLRSGAAEHHVLLAPPAYELDDTDTQLYYTSPVDVAQMVRDAVALTIHLHCDQTSCPAWTNILAGTTGSLDFRNQSVKQVIETARSLAGPTWYWYVDEFFRVWFQPMGSGAVYTIPRSQYEERTKVASIQNRKNRVVAVGGVPVGGSAAVQYSANETVSQSTIGIRALAPPLNLPNITDRLVIQNIATNVLAVLNRIWNRVDLKLNPSYGRRIHGSWPGGAMIRYWEPSSSPLPEGVQGSGNYSGSYICQSVMNDGLNQKVVAGDIPVTSQTDIQNMANSQIARLAANAVQMAGATLNQTQQVMTGTLVSGTAQAGTGATAIAASQWSLDPTQFQTFDANGTPRVQMGNLAANGISAAQFGIRVNDASGNPISDSLGLIGVMVEPTADIHPGTTSITGATSPTALPGYSMTFTTARQANYLFLATINCKASSGPMLVGFSTDSTSLWDTATSSCQFDSAVGGYVTSPVIEFATLAAGSHTIRLLGTTGSAPRVLNVNNGDMYIFQLGG